MTALPKRKPSSRRQGRRRATHKITLSKTVPCPHCAAPKRPLLTCPNCQK